MAIVETNLRAVRESAAQIRFYPVGPFTATNVQDAIQDVENIVQPTPIVVNVGMSPYTPPATASLLMVDTSGGAITIQMPLAATRSFDLEIKDATGNSAANPITVLPTAPETIDGLTVGAGGYPIDSNFASARLGVKAVGYFVHA